MLLCFEADTRSVAPLKFKVTTATVSVERIPGNVVHVTRLPAECSFKYLCNRLCLKLRSISKFWVLIPMSWCVAMSCSGDFPLPLLSGFFSMDGC